MTALASRWRQLRFPRPFRLRPAADDADALLAAALSEILRQAVPPEPARPSPAAPPPPAQVRETMPEAFVIALCNDYFRLKRNAELIANQDSKEVRSIRRTLDRLRDVFGEHGIECIDLTGQAYHHGRVDFEPIGKAEPTAGVDAPRISASERPAVLLKGQLVQKARGTVVRPLDGAQKEVSS
jgi:hypothetical protein